VRTRKRSTNEAINELVHFVPTSALNTVAVFARSLKFEMSFFVSLTQLLSGDGGHFCKRSINHVLIGGGCANTWLNKLFPGEGPASPWYN
jgi:hypothetical protein